MLFISVRAFTFWHERSGKYKHLYITNITYSTHCTLQARSLCWIIKFFRLLRWSRSIWHDHEVIFQERGGCYMESCQILSRYDRGLPGLQAALASFWISWPRFNVLINIHEGILRIVYCSIRMKYINHFYYRTIINTNK